MSLNWLISYLPGKICFAAIKICRCSVVSLDNIVLITLWVTSSLLAMCARQ